MHKWRCLKRFHKNTRFSLWSYDGFSYLAFFLILDALQRSSKSKPHLCGNRGISSNNVRCVDVVVNIATSTFVDDPTAFFLLLIRKWIPHNHNITQQLILSSSWRKHPKIIISYVLFPLIHKLFLMHFHINICFGNLFRRVSYHPFYALNRSISEQ